jgi:quinol monooxygenase YgiN
MNAGFFRQTEKAKFAGKSQLDVAPDHFDAFLLLVNRYAKQSVELETACLQFDVLVPATGDKRSSELLYEVNSSASSLWSFQQYLS